MKNNEENGGTEQAIMAAAEELFLEKGYNRATTTMIAAKAGVTHAMLHYYFRSKEQIFTKVLDKNLEELLASFRPVMKSGAPFWETLESGISTHFDYLMKHPELPNFIFETARYNPELMEAYKPSIRETLQRILDFHIDVLQKEMESGNISRTDPVQLMLDIVTLNLSAFMFIPTVGKVFPEIGEDRLEQMLSGRKAEIITLIKSRLYGNSHE